MMDGGSMNSKIEGLKLIAAEYLYPGVVLAEDIYNHNATVLLLAKGNILNESNIQRIKEFNGRQRNISVFPDTYTILRQYGVATINSLSSEYIEGKVGYSELKKDTGKLLSNMGKTHAVSKGDTEPITDEIQKKLHEINLSLLFQCVNTPKPIDEYLQRHSINVGMLNGLLGKWMGQSDEEIGQLVISGLVHDIGKTEIPTSILDAPRRLTGSEYEVMKMHPLYSYNLLKADKSFSNEVCTAAKQHHERVNGAGYPYGLRMEQISLFAKITAVSDVYDAMVSKRSYKEANSPFAILAQLAQQQFSELDMHIVNIFTEKMPIELIGKPVLLSDFSIGVVRYLAQDDLKHPLVEVNGEIKKTDSQFYCMRMVMDE